MAQYQSAYMYIIAKAFFSAAPLSHVFVGSFLKKQLVIEPS